MTTEGDELWPHCHHCPMPCLSDGHRVGCLHCVMLPEVIA